MLDAGFLIVNVDPVIRNLVGGSIVEADFPIPSLVCLIDGWCFAGGEFVAFFGVEVPLAVGGIRRSKYPPAPRRSRQTSDLDTQIARGESRGPARGTFW